MLNIPSPFQGEGMKNRSAPNSFTTKIFKMTEQQNNEPQIEPQDENKLIAERRAKLAAIREKGSPSPATSAAM